MIQEQCTRGRYYSDSIAHYYPTVEAGIRFFDIRIKQVRDVFEIYHGPIPQMINLGQVLDQMTSFLKANPSEVVLLRISKEGDPEFSSKSFTDLFQEYLKKYGKLFCLSAR